MDVSKFFSNDVSWLAMSKVISSSSHKFIRRLIKSNGIKLNNETVLDEKYIIDPNLFSNKGFIKLSIGKKKHFKITN